MDYYIVVKGEFLMEPKNKKNRASSITLFIAGIIIFICGLLIFIFEKSTVSFIYTVVLCGSGIVFILFAMIRDFALRSKKMRSTSSETDNDKK